VLGVWLVTLAALQPAGPPDVVVTAAPPVNAERLADALRTYLAEYGIRVETAGATAGGDLRQQLDDARQTGEAVRAVAVVRAEPGASGSIEIDLVDLATQKALVTSVPRAPRDEDMYRTLALKIEALMRATLSEAPERVASRSGVARLVAPAPAPEGVVASSTPPAAPRWSLEAGYALLSFPLGGGATFQGLSAAGAFLPRPHLELGARVAGLASEQLPSGDVTAKVRVVPIAAFARARWSRARVELLAGPIFEAALVDISPSSSAMPPATVTVRASRDTILALGADVEARVRISAAAWLYLQPTALAVLSAPRYEVQGRPVFDASRFQVSAAAGIGLGLP
jgi:hypothetical protein